MNYQISPFKLIALAAVFGIGFSTTNALAKSSVLASGDLDFHAVNRQTLAQATGDIVDVASDNATFSTLVQAVQAAELVTALQGPGPLTVFAPTNAAFDDLPDGVLDALLMPENQDLLTAVLTYHVVPDEVMASELTTGTLETLNGGVAIDVSPERIVVNNASVVQADVPASNGVIHAINRVLIPQGVVAELQSRTADGSAQEPIRGLW